MQRSITTTATTTLLRQHGHRLTRPLHQIIIPSLVPSHRRQQQQFQQTLNYSSRVASTNYEIKALPAEVHVLDPWVPTPFSQRPSLFSKAGFDYYKKALIRNLQSTYHVYKVKKAFKSQENLPTFAPTSFGKEVENLYIGMNEAFAKSDKASLSRLVTPGMLVTLSSDMKKFKKDGKELNWVFKGHVAKPTVQVVRIADVAGSDATKVVQVTVKYDTNQTLVVYKNGKRVSGDEDKVHNVTEYVVFERWLSENNSDGWRIAGKTFPEY